MFEYQNLWYYAKIVSLYFYRDIIFAILAKSWYRYITFAFENICADISLCPLSFQES